MRRPSTLRLQLARPLAALELARPLPLAPSELARPLDPLELARPLPLAPSKLARPLDRGLATSRMVGDLVRIVVRGQAV